MSSFYIKKYILRVVTINLLGIIFISDTISFDQGFFSIQGLIYSINNFSSDKIEVLNNKYNSGCRYSHRCKSFSKECEIFSNLIKINSNHKSSCVKNNIIN